VTSLLLCAALGLFDWGRTGTTAMPFLRLSQGVRASAMGEAYVALSDDASALFWNPAGLGRLSRYHFTLTHQQWFTDTKDELVHASFPSGPGALGISAAYTSDPGIEAWDENNRQQYEFSTWQGAVALGYGATIVPGFQLGLAAKGFYQDLHTGGFGSGGGADLGVMYQPLRFLRIGAAARNFGVGYYSGELLDLPSEASVGVNYRGRECDAVLDFVYPMDNDWNIRAGLEYRPIPQLGLRLGYRTGPFDPGTLGYMAGLTAGLGASLGNLSLDYAIVPYGALGLTHRIGLSVRATRKGTGYLAISVVDRADGSPLWADLAFSGVLDQMTGTNRRGELELTGLRPGTLVIRTSHSGYAPRVDTLLILGDREQSAVISLDRLTYGGIWGSLHDAITKEPVSGAVSYQGPVYGEQPVDEQSGSFTLRNLPSGTYTLTAAGADPAYYPQTCTLEVKADQMQEKQFLLSKKQQTIVLQGVNFETGKAEIKPEFEGALSQAGRILTEHPGVTVELAGHTDPREISTTEYPSNRELSQARAEAVRTYLIERLGIAPERLTAHGYADSQPIAPNDTDEGMAKNRRVEFRILSQ